jgi:hypothetical protein
MQYRVSVGIVLGIVPIFILCMNWPFTILLIWIGISTVILLCLCIDKAKSQKQNENLTEGFLEQSTLQKVIDA